MLSGSESYAFQLGDVCFPTWGCMLSNKGCTLSTRNLSFRKSVREVEEKKSITLLETPLYKGISRD